MLFRSMTLSETKRNKLVFGWPWFLTSAMASIGSFLPVPKPLRITADQVRLLRRDSVLSGRHRGLRDLGIQPTPIETIAPGVLARYRRRSAVAPVTR